ncbi:MAG: molecular chaperone TorD family protein [Hyphomicrobiales bacterium]
MPRPPLERSQIYRAFAAAFRSPDGGADLFGPDVLPPPLPPADAAVAFAAAFEPALDPGAASLYGRSYLKREQADLFEELVRWYSFFELKRAGSAELPDHVAVELDFLQFLTWREDAALQAGEDVADLRRAERDFIQRHLVPIAGGLSSALADRHDRYAMLPRRLAEFLAEELDDLKA